MGHYTREHFDLGLDSLNKLHNLNNPNPGNIFFCNFLLITSAAFSQNHTRLLFYGSKQYEPLRQ